MPFTPSHAVVAIPLRRLGLPLGAVAVGAMSPDTAVFLPWVFDYMQTHSLVGVVTTDLVVGVLVVSAWWAWLRAPVVDLLPDDVRRRLRLDPPLWRSARWWLSVVVGVALGALTHVCWDAFTHPGQWGSQVVPALRGSFGPWLVTSWLQYASGVVGLVGIGLWWRSVLRQRSPDDSAARVPRLRWPLGLLPVAGAAAGLVLWLASVSSGALPSVVIVRAVTLGGLGAAVGLVLLALTWHVTVLRRARAPRHGSSRTTRPGASTTPARPR
ncbi:uncharacterized protein DUF4184 [Humibacillus xanthopallidus]|uniref:Uncharacterized protein DUF4184 n=1 Tax=Humibacillus xanthopallidus TaxID=412689 RepID=A0A543PT15_9MICO|nr:DUF4184 family protein [Humibacillus xanthopallidus]TQN47225.1 uncharacterized protein DUF4184 [Humibacillus xanthopallidus]